MNYMIKVISLILILLVIGGCSNGVDMPTDLELSSIEIEGLNLALQDEYKAEATYKKVMDTFGEVKPFSNIIKAEIKHSLKLIELYNLYGLEVPENNWYNRTLEFESIKQACEVGVQAEIENIELYDTLFESTDKENILEVYKYLQRASEEKHLVAFQRCS